MRLPEDWIVVSAKPAYALFEAYMDGKPVEHGGKNWRVRQHGYREISDRVVAMLALSPWVEAPALPPHADQ